MATMMMMMVMMMMMMMILVMFGSMYNRFSQGNKGINITYTMMCLQAIIHLIKVVPIIRLAAKAIALTRGCRIFIWSGI